MTESEKQFVKNQLNKQLKHATKDNAHATGIIAQLEELDKEDTPTPAPTGETPSLNAARELIHQSKKS